MNKRIEHHKTFQKHFNKRIKPNEKLHKKFIERYGMFLKDKTNPLLDDHALEGSMVGERAIRITGDYRMIYYETEDCIFLLDIGTHNQVYN
ncbi:type II toxin-antitoxin system mRNA interferase toxin, RelE/StbE family [Candidatus Dojkabacteria bacterium]|nr:type II toxin-antitoxin system mRNA interferase toxin, RelE/StbE family [Candidatus Dojkabacteria bacterium]